VTSVSPGSGPTAGRQQCDPHRHRLFTGATTVLFGTVNASSFHGQLRHPDYRRHPRPKSAGTVDVTVTHGRSAPRLSAPPTGSPMSPPPSVTSHRPEQRARRRGGTTVDPPPATGFTATSTVMFRHGGGQRRHVSSRPPASPPSPRPRRPGIVDVTVTTAGGTSSTSRPADQFTFIAAPTVTARVSYCWPGGGRHHRDDHRDRLSREQRRSSSGSLAAASFMGRIRQPASPPSPWRWWPLGTVDINCYHRRRHLRRQTPATASPSSIAPVGNRPLPDQRRALLAGSL